MQLADEPAGSQGRSAGSVLTGRLWVALLGRPASRLCSKPPSGSLHFEPQFESLQELLVPPQVVVSARVLLPRQDRGVRDSRRVRQRAEIGSDCVTAVARVQSSWREGFVMGWQIPAGCLGSAPEPAGSGYGNTPTQPRSHVCAKFLLAAPGGLVLAAHR